MRRLLLRLLVGFAIVMASSLAACLGPRCDRSGCDALGSAVTDDGRSGIAGVVAGESDAIGNGCQECGFGSATLAIWKTDSPVGDAQAAKAVVNGSQPFLTVAAKSSYRLRLDPGHYLIRISLDAVAVEIIDGHLTTLHVKQINGPTQFILFDPRTQARQAAASFEVGL